MSEKSAILIVLLDDKASYIGENFQNFEKARFFKGVKGFAYSLFKLILFVYLLYTKKP